MSRPARIVRAVVRSLVLWALAFLFVGSPALAALLIGAA